MIDIVGLLQNPQFLSGAGMLMRNPRDQQMLQGIAQMQMQKQAMAQQKSREEAEMELMELRRQTLQNELGTQQRRQQVGQELGGLLSQPGFDQQQAMGLLAELDPMAAARSAGIGGQARQRRIMDDPTGIPRYVDSGEPVFPGIQAPAPVAEPGQQPFEGLAKRGQEGWMQAALANAELKRRRGEPLTQEEEIAVQTAQHSLTQPKIMMGPAGERLEYTPGLPPYAVPPAGLLGQSGPALPPDTPAAGGFLQPPGEDVPRGTMRQITGTKQEAARAQSMDRAAGSIMGVIDILDEAKRSGENITGLLGAAKASGGASIARQFGVPVSTRAESLDRELASLKAALKPLMTGETGSNISDKDVKDLEKIIDTLSWKTDETAIRHGMSQLRDIMIRMGK